MNQARRRVALALLFAKITEDKKIRVDSGAIKARIEQIASQYEHPEQVVQYYMSNKNLLRQVEHQGPVLAGTRSVSGQVDRFEEFDPPA